MKPPFDIAADLDTPVSAYLKLAPFRPRFLLESVEGGERLARYSFIGFGDCLEFRLDAARPDVGRRGAPAAHRSRRVSRGPARGLVARAAAPARGAGRAAVRRPGGLHRLRLPCATSSACAAAASTTPQVPHAHYVAPRSLLVFDHLTRGVALLHAGSEAERQSLRREVVQALRGAVPALQRRGTLLARHALAQRDRARGARAARAGVHRRGRCVSAGAGVALRGPA